MIKWFKKLRFKLATYVVTAYANRIFWRAVKIADKRHQQENTIIYVASSIENQRKLVTYNRQQFRYIKNKLYLQKFYITRLKEQCWYMTPDKSGKNGLSQKDIEIRRLAFVRQLLHAAKLL